MQSRATRLAAAADSEIGAAPRGRAPGLVAVQRGNLRGDETRFIGREAELEVLREALSAERALVTLVGPPGIGKTRLACHVGRELLLRLPVWVCDLSGARSAAEASSMIVRALDLTGASPKAGQDALGPALERLGSGLIVLDNVEQLGDVAELVSTLRTRTARVGLLATSLEPLGVYGERVVRVPALATDDAIALFEDRARWASEAEASDEPRRQLLAALVDRLDGLPLAIELAAAQADVLSPQEILSRLDDGFSLLRSPRRDVIPRHATLEAAILSAWNLLAPGEQLALAQCALFAASFSLEALQAVVRLPDGGAPAVEELRRLMRSSLIRRVQASPARYGLYRAVRAFAGGALATWQERGASEARHAAYVLGAAEAHATEAARSDEAGALEALAALHDDIVEIWQRERARDPIVATRAALAARPLLTCFGPAGTDASMFEQVVEIAAGAGERWLALAHVARGEYRFLAGRLDEAAADLAAAGELAERLALTDVSIDCLRVEARIDNQRADGVAAALRLTRALELLEPRSPPDRLREAEVLASLAFAEQRLHRLDQASAHYEHAIERYRAVGSRRGEALALRGLGTVAARQGRWDAELACYRAALSLVRGGRDPVQETLALVSVAHALHERGALAEACEMHDDALALAGHVGWRRIEGVILCYAGWLDLEEARLEQGERRLQQALVLLREADDPRFEAAVHYALAWRHLTAGSCSSARRHLDSALERSRRGGDRMIEAFARSLEIALAAHVDDLAAAERALAAARELTADRARHEMNVVETYAGFLDLARARAAERAGRFDGAARHVGEARAHIAGVQGGESSSDVRMARRLFDAAASAWTASTRVLDLAADTTWFAAPGRPPVSLARRVPLRQILRCLADDHMHEPGRVVDWRELLGAGWPGQRTLGSSGQQRVRTAIWTLRRLGLAEVIETVGDSYRIDPTVRVRQAGE